MHQDSALARIAQSIASGRFPHALIFAGPDGVGKRMMALRVARGLLCAHGPSATDPSGCGQCDDCAAAAAGAHLDLHMVHRMLSRLHPDKSVRARKATELSVDVIRYFLIEPIGRRPVRGRAKVFIVEEAEKLNDNARNALLKTLEEPPGSAYIILLASSEDRLGETIRSRCQLVRFGRMPDDFVRAHLTLHAGVPADHAAYLAYLADGRVGFAASLAQSGILSLRERVDRLSAVAAADPAMFSKEAQDIVKLIAAGEAEDSGDADDSDDGDVEAPEDGEASAAKSAGDSAKQREARRMMLAMLSTSYRDHIRRGAMTRNSSASAAIHGASAAIRAIAEAESQLDRSVNPALVFDGLGIRLGRRR